MSYQVLFTTSAAPADHSGPSFPAVTNEPANDAAAQRWLDEQLASLSLD